MDKRIVVKVGSNVLTREDGKLDVTRMSAIVDQIVWLKQQGYEVILVSSGAVAAGRAEHHVEHHLDSVEQRQLFSAIGQVKLIGLYYDLFREYKIKIGQVLTMKENFGAEEQYKNQEACMEVMLENGVLPIVNENDTVCITELMFTDNDELSGLIAQMMKADTLILLTNVDGIYNGDPCELIHASSHRYIMIATSANTYSPARAVMAVAVWHLRQRPPRKLPMPASRSSSPMAIRQTSSST